MRRLIPGVIVALLLSTMGASAQQRLHPDQSDPPGMDLLPGYQHERYVYADGSGGRIWKTDGLDIRYEVGGWSANRVSAANNRLWTKTRSLGRRQAQIALTEDHLLIVNITMRDAPRRGGPGSPLPINFYAAVGGEEDIVDMLLMVLDYARE